MNRGILSILLIVFIGVLNAQTFVPSRFSDEQLNENLDNFIVEYSNIPIDMQQSMNYAFSILDKFFITDIPVKVAVVYKKMTATGLNVIGGAKPSNVYVNIDDRLLPDVFYPVALAEKILSTNLNNDNPDITLTINSDCDCFYIPIDGKCDSTKKDLVTFTIHEIIHGLGFYSSISVDGNIAYFEGGYPTIFDMFVVDSTGKEISKLKDSDLYKAVISDSLFIKAPYSLHDNLNSNPQLYAPLVFDEGGTYSHIDFGQPTEHSLMNVEFWGSIHDPSNFVLGIMSQIGWNDYFIDIDEIKDTENYFDTITISTYVDTCFQKADVLLIYSLDNFINRDTALMNQRNDNIFEGKIPPTKPVFDHNVRFYISCEDIYGNVIQSSINDTVKYYKSFFVGIDNIKPEINHNKIVLFDETQNNQVFNALISDNIKVDSVYVTMLYKLGDSIVKVDTIDMNLVSENYYSCDVSFDGDILFKVDSILYKIEAIDSSKNKNMAVFPVEGYIRASIFRASSVIVTYIEDFDGEDHIFNLNGFTVSTETGFDNKALHSTHFYLPTGKDMVYNQYIAEIKKPVKISTVGAFIEFDEVVLVEPSEFGTEFGEFGFWDYVIVEGSKNKVDWHAFELLGYNSRLYTSWMQKFYSSLDNIGNSIAVGDKSLFFNHKINLLKNKFIRPGDYVYIRFRLQSDTKISAWGWCIDNLKIQKDAPVEIFENHNVKSLYRNDVSNSLLYIETEADVYSSVYSVAGELLLTTVRNVIDYSNFESGIYLVNSIFGSINSTYKLIVE